MAKRILMLIAYIALFIGFYTLLDYLYSRFITSSDFEFKIGANLIFPGILAIVTGLLLVWHKENKEDKKEK